MIVHATVPTAIAVTVLLVTTGVAIADCPSRPLGVQKEGVPGHAVFYATERAEALTTSDESRALAAAEARVFARQMLADDKNVPKDSRGALRGARNVGICTLGEFVFATVMIDEASVRRALALSDAMRASIEKSPTPK